MEVSFDIQAFVIIPLQVSVTTSKCFPHLMLILILTIDPFLILLI